MSPSFSSRHGFTAGLWIGTTVLVGFVAVQGLPWLWPRLFPRPGEGLVTAAPAEQPRGEVPTPQIVGEIVDRLVASWGAELGAPEAPLHLPRGRTPRALQDALREEPILAQATIYVTPLDAATHRLRVFDGPRLLLMRDLRRWMPERPALRASDPPELALVFRFAPDDPATLGRILKWKTPMAVAMPAFSPQSLRAAGKAVKAGKDVVVELDPAEPLADQIEALPGVTGVLLAAPLPAPEAEAELDALLAARDLFLLDAREDALREREAGRALRLPRAAQLDDEESAVLGRNLAVRWGHGVVTVDATGEGPDRAEAFLEIAREDGYAIRLPAEVAREHGRPPAP